MTGILSASNVTVDFDIGAGFPRKILRAVDDVTFSIREGEALGIVGESGCGKSTLARAALRLIDPADGNIVWLDRDVTNLGARKLRALRGEIQVIFQDPLASLDPRMTIGDSIAEPLRALKRGVTRKKANEKVRNVMEQVGLSPDLMNRYPHEFSGGQLQRAGIARALITDPKLIVCDEPVSALDVSIQGQIINLLNDLRQSLGLSLFFISHDLSVVRHLCDRVMVLYLGRMMELAPADRFYRSPAHPYSRVLLAAVPKPGGDFSAIPGQGETPSPLSPPSGCVFRTRCPKAERKCADIKPEFRELSPGHGVACHFPES